MAKKTWNRSQINLMLQRNPRAVERAMVVLYNRQTADEQRSQDTRHQNGIGFSAYAARSGTYYANWVNKGRRLTGSHLEKARKIALKHSRQLVDEANAKAQKPAELTNEALAHEMNAENYGATGVDRYEHILKKLKELDDQAKEFNL